jgi:putative lipoprotein
MRASLPRTASPHPILLSLALAACSGTPPADRPASDTTASDTSAAGRPAGADTVGLVGPVWRLVEFRGGDDTRLTPDDPAKYILEFKPDGGLIARIDCNRGRGTWKSSGPSLELGPLALTRAACPPGSLHDRIVRHWPSIRSYVVKDGHLHLALMADGGIYEFEPSSDAAPAGGATLQGTATYRERMALPPGAVFEAHLEDVSRADAPAEVIGKTSLPSPGNPPIRFAIGYDPARIQAGHSYVVRARILVDGRPFFTTTESHPVLTRGSPDSISLMLRRAEPGSAATLENTYWKATAIGDRPARVAENIPEPHLLLHPGDTRASGSTGCNSLSGSYQLSGDSLRFGNLLSTLRACVDPELNRQERTLLDAFGATRTWRVTGDTLVLSDGTRALARFTAQYMR